MRKIKLKKSILLTLIISSFFGVVSQVQASTRADVDQNSAINATDAMLTLRNSIGLSSTNWVAGIHTGDVNCDNVVTSADAMLLLKYSLGLNMSGTGWCVVVKKYPVDTTFDPKVTANIAKPNYLSSYIDPVFGNKVTRITDRATQTANAKPYPKTQVWNSDMSLIRLGYKLYNANDFSEITTTQNNLIRGSLTEMKWSTRESNVFYGIDKRSDRFVFVRATIDLNNNTINYSDMPNATFLKTEYDELTLGKYEGNLDFNDNYVVFAGRKKNTNRVTLNVYETHSNQLTAQHDFPNIKWYVEDNRGNFNPNDGSNSNQIFDWASISALGNYVIVNYKSKPGDAEQEYSIEQYDRQLNHIRRLADHGNHGDLGVDANGREVYVQFGYGVLNGQDNRGIWMYPLDGSARVRLLPDKYNGGHISCRNYQRPGWCYVDTRAEGFQEVFAIKLDGSGTVERFAQTHSTDINHEVVQVNPSPDGTQALFNSDWGNTNNVIDTYNVQVP